MRIILQDRFKDADQTHTIETEHQSLSITEEALADQVSQKIKKEVSSNELKRKNNSFQSCFFKDYLVSSVFASVCFGTLASTAGVSTGVAGTC